MPPGQPTSPLISQDAIRRMLMQGGDPSSMFSGDPSQQPAPSAPTPPASGTLAANMSPAAPPAPTTPTTPSGTLSAAMTPPPSKTDYLAANPVALPARPRGEFDKIPDGQPGADTWGNRHNDLRHGLASIFAGMQEFGRPGQGFETVNRWGKEEEAKRNYDQNQPVLKQQAENQQYSTALGQGQQAAEIGKTQVETGTRFLPGQQKVLDQIRADKQAGKFPDDKSLFQAHLQDLQTTPGLTRQMLIDAINNTPTLGSKYTVIKGENGRPEGLQDRTGKQYGPDQIPPDPEAQTAWTSAQAGHTQARAEKLSDQKEVEGAAATRMAQSFSNQQQMEATKKMQPSVDTALTADQRLARMEKSYTKGVAGDQQAQLALLADHLGMTFGMQKGAKLNRGLIEEAQQSQPWLAKIGARFDKDGYLSGVALGPEQMKQMLDLGYDARDQAWKGAHDASTTWGIPLPPGAQQVEQQRQPGAKPLLQQGGQGGDVIYARDPQGTLHKAAKGTALPQGWKADNAPAAK